MVGARAVILMAGLMLQFGWGFSPAPDSRRVLVAFGDSLTAGFGGGSRVQLSRFFTKRT